MTHKNLLPHSDKEELGNAKGSLRHIVIVIVLLPFPLFLLTLADYLGGAIVHKSWVGFWLHLLQSSITPAGMLFLNFSYDLIIVLIFLLLPAIAMLVRASCPKSVGALAKRFMLLELQFLLLWSCFFSFCFFLGCRPTFWRTAVMSSGDRWQAVLWQRSTFLSWLSTVNSLSRS